MLVQNNPIYVYSGRLKSLNQLNPAYLHTEANRITKIYPDYDKSWDRIPVQGESILRIVAAACYPEVLDQVAINMAKKGYPLDKVNLYLNTQIRDLDLLKDLSPKRSNLEM